MKNRGICLGSMVFLGLIIALVAGCNPGLGPETGAAPLVDENGNYIITVNTAMAARSIAAADASSLAKEYEVVCRLTTSPNTYYAGYTYEGPLTVSLPAGTYDMLLLAGDGNRVLLGTGWLAAQAIGPETGSVAITVFPLTILESKMSFNDGIVTPTAPSGTPPAFVPDLSSTTLTTTFEIDHTTALEAAGAAVGISDIYTATNGFLKKDVVLAYYDDTPGHKDQFVRATLTASPGVGGTAGKVLVFPPLTYLPPATNWSAAVYLEVLYIPFSQSSPPAGSHTWSIMNGRGKKFSNGAVYAKSGDGGGFDITVSGGF
jgi:hypothetical protein